MEKRKSMLDILVVPLAIAIVGTVGTYLVTEQEIKSSEILRKAQIESMEKLTHSNQNIKIVEIFSTKIASRSAKDREMAVRILGALEPDLAHKLISAIAESHSNDTLIRDVASNMKEVIHQGYSYAVVGEYDRLIDAIKKAEILSKDKLSFPIKIYKSEKGIYNVCLGGELSHKEALVRIDYAITNGIVTSGHVRTSKYWNEAFY